MRKTIILILILIRTLTTVGQDNDYSTFKKENKCGENEIGINIYNITALKLKFYPYKFTANHNFVNGIMYKRHCNRSAIRIGFDYYYSKFSIEDSGKYHYSKIEGQNNIGELRIGYERKLTTTKLQPFLAADLSLTYGQIKGVSGGWGDIIWWYTESPYGIRIIEVGIAPTVGLKYRVINRLSITIEINSSLSYYQHKDLENSDNKTGVKIYFNPIRLLSLNYHF